MIEPAEARVLYCFDRDLRLDDNPALLRASEHAGELLCVYCHDAAVGCSDRFGTPRLGSHRQVFIEQALQDLAAALQSRDQALVVVRGDPVAEIGNLIEVYAIDRVVRGRAVGHHESAQWRQLVDRHPRVEFEEIDNGTLLEAAQVSEMGELPATFSKFRRLAEGLELAQPVALPSLPPAPDGILATGGSSGRVPGAENALFEGGEAAAWAHLERYFSTGAPGRYKQTRNALDGWSNSSKFSPWLAAGCVSPRRLLEHIRRYEAGNGANESTYWLFFELLWREYFQWYALAHGTRLFRFSGIGDRAPKTRFDRKIFDSWCGGDTRWPLVNACMRELNATGYLSNRGRQIVASALVNELEQDWRAGAGYFEYRLVDYDVASNWGNWQYIAGVGADPRGGRHFNLEKQAQQFDPDGEYVRGWLEAKGSRRAGEPVAGPVVSGS